MFRGVSTQSSTSPVSAQYEREDSKEKPSYVLHQGADEVRDERHLVEAAPPLPNFTEGLTIDKTRPIAKKV
jgi:hypothetical protein